MFDKYVRLKRSNIFDRKKNLFEPVEWNGFSSARIVRIFDANQLRPRTNVIKLFTKQSVFYGFTEVNFIKFMPLVG